MEDSGAGLSLTYKLKDLSGYEFYRCHMSVNDYSFSKSDIYVKGDFTYEGGSENESFWAKGGNYKLQDKDRVYNMNEFPTDSYTEFYANFYIDVSETND